MKTVVEYRQFAKDCRELAARLRSLCDSKERQALTLMSAAWEKVADQREASLQEQLKRDGADPA
jgi:hypothetical protein